MTDSHDDPAPSAGATPADEPPPAALGDPGGTAPGRGGLWAWLAGLGLLLAAVGLAIWGARLGQGLPRLAAVKAGALAVGASLAAVLGLLLLARVRDAALAAVALADAGALVVLLVGLGRVDARVALAWPVAALIAALVGVTLAARASGRRRPGLGVLVQALYLGALLYLGFRFAGGRLPAAA